MVQSVRGSRFVVHVCEFLVPGSGLRRKKRDTGNRLSRSGLPIGGFSVNMSNCPNENTVLIFNCEKYLVRKLRDIGFVNIRLFRQIPLWVLLDFVYLLDYRFPESVTHAFRLKILNLEFPLLTRLRLTTCDSRVSICHAIRQSVTLAGLCVIPARDCRTSVRLRASSARLCSMASRECAASIRL